jgi:hypothetical protein
MCHTRHAIGGTASCKRRPARSASQRQQVCTPGKYVVYVKEKGENTQMSRKSKDPCLEGHF